MKDYKIEIKERADKIFSMLSDAVDSTDIFQSHFFSELFHAYDEMMVLYEGRVATLERRILELEKELIFSNLPQEQYR